MVWWEEQSLDSALHYSGIQFSETFCPPHFSHTSPFLRLLVQPLDPLMKTLNCKQSYFSFVGTIHSRKIKRKKRKRL